MKYGLTVKDMRLAREMMRNPCKHDWVMGVLRQVYQMRVKSGGIESENC